MTSQNFSLLSWSALADGVHSHEEWRRWSPIADMSMVLPNPDDNQRVPGNLPRRLDKLGRCIFSVVHDCLQQQSSTPAVLTTSRHSNIHFLEDLLVAVEQEETPSPSVFACSVHNYYPGLISMKYSFTNVIGTVACMKDGFALALAEGISLLDEQSHRNILVIAYEPEIPHGYQSRIEHPWIPHVGAFLLGAPSPAHENYELYYDVHRQSQNMMGLEGSCLNFVLSLVHDREGRDGCWGWRRL